MLRDRAAQRNEARAVAHAKWSPPTPAPATLPVARRLLLGSAGAMSASLRSGAVTSEALTLACCERVHAVGWALNAATHELFAAALADARASDARRAAGAPLGALDGVPISVKDVFEVGGEDTTAGLAARAFRAAPRDGLLVRMLRAAGLVVVCKSNVPQCLMVPESDNFVFGRSLNPWAGDRTPGGSSGGEGALVAAQCVPLGLGSDIGGSIRIPAAFCGVCGFKPTAPRLTRRGMPAPRPAGVDGQCAVLPTAGPLARRVGDLRLLMAALLSDGEGGQWGLGGDPTVPLLPWSYAAFEARRRGLPGRMWRAAASVPPPGGAGGAPRPLRVGVLAGDGFWEAAPACARAVREAAAALAAGGHEVAAWDPRAAGAVDLRRAAVVYYALMAADGGLAEFKAGLEGERLHPMYSLLNVLASLPWLLRAPIAAALRALGQERAAELLATARGRSTREYWAIVAEREQIRDAFFDAWRAAGFDVLLCPAMGVPAFPHGGSRDLTPACSATFLWNLLDAPAGVLPVTRVRADECVYEAPPAQADAFAAAAQRAMVGAEGLPVGVQVVGLPWRDEETLEAMEVRAKPENARSTPSARAALSLHTPTPFFFTPFCLFPLRRSWRGSSAWRPMRRSRAGAQRAACPRPL